MDRSENMRCIKSKEILPLKSYLGKHCDIEDVDTEKTVKIFLESQVYALKAKEINNFYSLRLHAASAAKISY
jgi:hypothetical protein